MRLPLGPKAQLRAMISLWVYDCFKLALAYKVMVTYGINPWIFFFLDMVTVPPYIVGWCRLIKTLTGTIQPFKTIFLWSVVTFIASTAPYIYAAWAGGRSFPAQAWVILILLVIFPVFNLFRKVREEKKRQATTTLHADT